MNDEQRMLVNGALSLLENQVRHVRQAVEAGAPTSKVRTLMSELQKQTAQYVTAIDLHIGASALLDRVEQAKMQPLRAKPLSSSKPSTMAHSRCRDRDCRVCPRVP